jgi:hypothetical protein
MAQLTADELRELLLVQSLIRRDQPIAPFPDRLLDLDLVWRDPCGKVHMTVEGLRVAKAPSGQAVATEAPFACHLPAPRPDDDTADTSIEHWYFCGAGSAMRSR